MTSVARAAQGGAAPSAPTHSISAREREASGTDCPRGMGGIVRPAWPLSCFNVCCLFLILTRIPKCSISRWRSGGFIPTVLRHELSNASSRFCCGVAKQRLSFVAAVARATLGIPSPKLLRIDAGRGEIRFLSGRPKAAYGPPRKCTMQQNHPDTMLRVGKSTTNPASRQAAKAVLAPGGSCVPR